MKLLQTIPAYYKEINLPPPKHASFHVGRHESNLRTIKRKQEPVRHELYSISITNIQAGDLRINYQSALSLFIISPFKIIGWDITERSVEGMYIIFDKNFIASQGRWKNFLTQFPFFRFDHPLIGLLPEKLLIEILGYFEKIATVYQHNDDQSMEMIAAYVHIILLLLKNQLAPTPANSSISSNQLLLATFEGTLLEAISKPDSTPDFRKASFYASRLHVHVNHLNAVLKEMTGKTTSEHIQQSILQETGIMLLRPGQSIQQIAHRFRFRAATHFSAFFKKQTSLTPKQYQLRHNQST